LKRCWAAARYSRPARHASHLYPTARAYPFNVRILSSSAFQEHTSCGWRFFFQPFSSRLPAAGAPFNLSGAYFLRLVLLLSAFQEHIFFGWRFFFQPLSSRLLSTDASSLSLSGADFLRLALLLVGTRFFAAFPPPNDLA
jgi:hypothetical protein